MAKVGETLGVWMEQSSEGQLTVRLFLDGKLLTQKQAHAAAGVPFEGADDAIAFEYESFKWGSNRGGIFPGFFLFNAEAS